jgi:hypothetical protein
VAGRSEVVDWKQPADEPTDTMAARSFQVHLLMQGSCLEPSLAEVATSSERTRELEADAIATLPPAGAFSDELGEYAH